MTWVLIVLAILLGLFFSGLFSGSETGLYCANRLRIELNARQSQPEAVRLKHLLADEQGALSVLLIGTNVSNYVTTTAVAYLLAALVGVPEARAELYTVAIVTPVVFVFGEVVPKNLFQLHADYLMGLASAPLIWTSRICRATGLVGLLKLFVSAANRLTGALHTDAITTPRRRIATLLQEALVERGEDAEQSELVDRVVQLSETAVQAIMVPRNRVTTIRATADRAELLRIARRTNHARLPVYETVRTNVVGLIKVDELLRRDDWRTVGERMEAVAKVSPYVTVAGAIRTLRELRRSFAVVADHHGRMLGIVTLTDLLEELVG